MTVSLSLRARLSSSAGIFTILLYLLSLTHLVTASNHTGENHGRVDHHDGYRFPRGVLKEFYGCMFVLAFHKIYRTKTYKAPSQLLQWRHTSHIHETSEIRLKARSSSSSQIFKALNQMNLKCKIIFLGGIA